MYDVRGLLACIERSEGLGPFGVLGRVGVTGDVAVQEVLATPAVAVTLGVIVGAGLMAPLLWSSRFAYSEKPDRALYAAMVSSMGGVLVGAGILYGYYALAKEGFVWFGPSLIAGFVLGLGVVTILLMRRMAKSDDETRS